jgi:hypothetical protein
MNIRKENVVSCQDWDELVEKTYGRPYKFQQQDGCRQRGVYRITVSSDGAEDFEEGEIPEEVNGSVMGVSFKAWLARDPKKELPGKDDKDDFSLKLFWYRNFYPSIEMVANDLHAKGLLPEGDYTIDIDW